MNDYWCDLGDHGFPVTTSSAAAQTWFDRGLAWCYGFHHDEAVACFERALEHDPACAMARWGIAYATGPNYNQVWTDYGEAERAERLSRAREESRAALAGADNAAPVEKALAAALVERFPFDDGDDYDAWNDAYADAMRTVYRDHGGDLDVCALFADALLNRTPWKLWDIDTGAPADGADTMEAIEVIETAFESLDGATRHAGLLHMHIHAWEMSPHPERALRSGDTLHAMAGDAGHLLHMPTHIDVLCGDYQNVVARNLDAVAADDRYVAREGIFNRYTGYRVHDLHFLVYGAMFLGQYRTAIEAADKLVRTLPAELLASGDPPFCEWLEGYVPIRQHVLIRFGRWQDILDQELPEDRELFCTTTAMTRYARTVALAATGRVAEAEAERDLFMAARDRVPESRILFHNTCLDILAIAEQMLLGELEYRKGNLDAAFDHLRRSVELDDTLPYDEPWGWMQPARHALGALLMEQGCIEEAEAVYRADLGLDGTLRRPCQHPGNVWSLHGLHECLRRRGAAAEAAIIRQQLDLAMARADVPVKASCYCRLQHAA